MIYSSLRVWCYQYVPIITSLSYINVLSSKIKNHHYKFITRAKKKVFRCGKEHELVQWYKFFLKIVNDTNYSDYYHKPYL